MLTPWRFKCTSIVSSLHCRDPFSHSSQLISISATSTHICRAESIVWAKVFSIFNCQEPITEQWTFCYNSKAAFAQMHWKIKHFVSAVLLRLTRSLKKLKLHRSFQNAFSAKTYLPRMHKHMPCATANGMDDGFTIEFKLIIFAQIVDNVR